MINISLADLRQNYTRGGLVENEAHPNPFKQFKLWFEQALEAQILEPNAMTLATVTPEGKPAARIVLLKDLDEKGFVFFTNYNSHKGKQLAQNPWASLVFWWEPIERQVRIEGKVEKVSEAESDEYFPSRPINSQLGSWASGQSEVVASREVLETRLEQFRQKYEGQGIPRPAHWGGYRVIPSAIEFWQGRPSRLHDRLYYSLQDDGSWLLQRLCP